MKATSSFCRFAAACLFSQVFSSPLIAQTFTWDGGAGDDLFGSGANWVGDAAPSVGSGVVLQFDGSVRPTPNNNYTTGDDFGEVRLRSTAGADFTITGNGFGLHGKIENDAGSGRTLAINTAGIYARANIQINPVGGNIAVGALVALDENRSLDVYDGGNGRTLTLNGALTQGNGVGGAGSLILNQTATVILAADGNTYGTSTINTGTTLRVGAGGATGSLGSGAVTNNGSLVFNRADNLAVGNAISGSGSVSVEAATGTVTFNSQKSYTGGTTITAGVLDLTGGGGASGTIRGTANVNGGTLRLSTGDATGYNTGAASLTTINLNGGTLNVNTTANQTLGGAVINMTGGSITGIASSNLDFFNNTSALNVLDSAVTSTISGTKINLRQNNGVTFTVADGASAVDLLVSSTISNAGGFTDNNFKKAGPGTMQLSGGNTYNTATEVLGGRLLVTGTLRDTSGITVSPGAVLELGGVNIFTGGHGSEMANSKVITVNAGTLLMNTGMDSRFGNITLNNGATWTSDRSLGNYDALLANTSTGAATVSVTGTGAATMNGSGGIHLQGVQNFSVANTTGDAAADLSVTMRLDNPGTTGGAAGGINKTGDGTMFLNNVGNSFAGDLIIAGGTIVTGTTQGGGVSGYLGAVNGTRTISVGTGATLDFRSNNQFGGGGKTAATIPAINIDGGTLTSTRFNILGNVTLNGGTLTQNNTSDAGAYQGFEFLGSVTIGGASVSTISSSNSTGNHLSSSGTTFNVGDATVGTDLIVSAPLVNASGDYGSGPGALVKQGAGTMVLSGANGYNGTTTVAVGTLLVNGTNSGSGAFGVDAGATLGGSGSIAGAVNVSGVLAPGASIESLATGTLSLATGSSVAYEANPLDANLADLIDITGDLNLDGSVTLDLSAADLSNAGWVLGNKLSIASYTGAWNNVAFTGFANGSNHLFGSNTWQILYADTAPGLNFTSEQSGAFLTLTVVPEPASAVLLAISSLALAMRRRRD